MGLIRAAVESVTGVLADQWKEYIYCEAMPSDVLMTKGHKRTKGGNRGDDNIITNGSGIAVADGQCMMIVEDGEIVEVCAEPGHFTYDTSTEPSIFSGTLDDAINTTFRLIGRRFSYGGDTGHDQRVYYFNTKELMDNKFGTPNPIPFRVVDARVNLDTEVDLRCSGVYSYRISDPLLFYTNVCGNVAQEFTRENIESQMKAEFVNAMAPALGKIAAKGIRPSELAGHYDEIVQAMREQLNQKWTQDRGLTLVSIALNPITLSAEDSERIKAAQTAAAYTNPAMGAGVMAQATAQAMKDAANNTSGAMTGFMGMGMAMNVGGANVANMYAQAQQNQQSGGYTIEQPAQQSAQTAPQSAQPELQSAQPAPQAGWNCSRCGTPNSGNFCTECGAPKPSVLPCSNCGYVPEDPTKLPKFCPQCGTKYGE